MFLYENVKRGDLDLLKTWFEKTHISKWLHGEGLKNTLRGLEKFTEGKPTETNYHLVFDEKKVPFAFLMSRKESSEDSFYKGIPFVGENIFSFDVFIGEESYLGQGVGTNLLKDFMKTKFPEASDFTIDPEASNKRAIHVYEKVGFKFVKEFIAPWHPVPHYLMHRKVHS